MLTRTPALALIAGWLLCVGCTRTTKGDLTPLLATELRGYGARLATNELPRVEARWKMIYKDTNGFQCIVLDGDYETIEITLQGLLGTNGKQFKSDVGPRACLFTALDTGVALNVIDKTNSVQITCLRGMTNWIGLGKE